SARPLICRAGRRSCYRRVPAAAEPKAAEVTTEAPAAESAPEAAPKTSKTSKTAKPKATESKAAEPVAAPEPVAATEEPAPAPEPAAAPEPPASPAKVDMTEPLPGYGQLTVASLRARMRGKTAEQIGDYLAYEKATTARPEVIKMFENRLAKLQTAE
ncbi:hypothetical protein ABZW11_45130, partial [Nonomuraea sp. NPDC004580]